MADTDEAPRKVLLEQAAALGLDVDGRWSVETLAEKVSLAQQNKARKEESDFAAAKKVPVRLLKNAFPLADKKVAKGEVVEVPVATAKMWLEAGVAVRADPLPGE